MAIQAREDERRGASRVIRSRSALKLAVFGFTALKFAPYAMSGVWPLTAWQQGYDVSLATVLLSFLLPVACVVVALGKIELHPDRIVYLGIGGYRTLPLRSITRAYEGKSSWLGYAILESHGKRNLFLSSLEFTKEDVARVLAFLEEQAREGSRALDTAIPDSQAKQDRLMSRFTFAHWVAAWLAVALLLVIVMG